MHARRVLLAFFLLVAPAARAQVGADWTAATGGSIRPGYDLNPCSATNSGALRYNTVVGQFQVCYGSGGWATLADASGTTPFYTDRITSGTAGIFVSSSGVITAYAGGFPVGTITSGSAGVVAIGKYAAYQNTGTNFVGFGPNAGYQNSGNQLVGLGANAAWKNSGSEVIALGTNAAYQNIGNQVVALGYTAGYQNTYTNVVILGAQAVANKANQIVLGNSSITEVTTSGVILSAGVSTTGVISATRFVGDGSGLTGLVAGDRITSGTAGVFVSNTGVINLRTGGVTTGYFDASGLLVAPGISITTANGISSTNGYFSGAVVNAPQANAGTSIDWSRGNVQYTSASCGAFTFTNMQDGGVYSLTVKGTTAGTCSFSQSGLTFRMPPNHGTVSTGTMTFYTFTRTGSDVMVNWMPGY